ncbi:MAG: hypothetical protein NTX49_02925 [Chlamydiae bacterium]|nr:hypothetical protein [Chlamydiota bacterium]
MRALFILFIFLLSPLSATYLFVFEEKDLESSQKKNLFDLILKGEPPRAFYGDSPIDLKIACEKVSPKLQLKWIPPSVWQLAVLHSFFNDKNIQKGILACRGTTWEPLEYEEPLHGRLQSAGSLQDVIHSFDSHTASKPDLSDLFFRVNKAALTLYNRASGSELEMVHIAISELPPFSEWKKKQFPFWKSPLINNPNSAQNFYNGVTDKKLFSELVKIELSAHENGEWVLYRGFPGLGLPSTLEIDDTSSHALSFGSTLLGGTFFSLDATAMTYSRPETQGDHTFLALRVTPEKMKQLFRVGPLHPFIQMLSDGEMFHAHTKIGAKNQEEKTDKPRKGYFMKCNKSFTDPIGYAITEEMSPEELEKDFISLCKSSGHIFETK